MKRLKLISPSIQYEEKVLSYSKDFIENKEILNGSGGLYKFYNFKEWNNYLLSSSNKNIIEEGKVPESTFLAISIEDNNLICMINIRHELDDHLFKFGGHIGYSVKKLRERKDMQLKCYL